MPGKRAIPFPHGNKKIKLLEIVSKINQCHGTNIYLKHITRKCQLYTGITAELSQNS